jgi:ATP-dependent Clp protease adaptor protein ClpS
VSDDPQQAQQQRVASTALAKREGKERRPWWRRAFAALAENRRRAQLQRQLQAVPWSPEAADAIRRISHGDGILDVLGTSAELEPFYEAIDIEIEGESREAKRAIYVAAISALSSGRARPNTGDLLYGLLRVDDAIARELAEGGLTRAALVTWLSHGVVAHPDVKDVDVEADALDVVLHNDDFTPQDVVVELLRTVFELEPRHAIKRMLEVHETGAAVIKSLPKVEAIDRVNRARRMMRERGFPLLITVERL